VLACAVGAGLCFLARRAERFLLLPWALGFGVLAAAKDGSAPAV
jgi:hypothetical protein